MAEREPVTARLARLEERLAHIANGLDEVRRRLEHLEERHLEEARFVRGQNAEDQRNRLRNILMILGPVAAVCVSLVLNRCAP